MSKTVWCCILLSMCCVSAFWADLPEDTSLSQYVMTTWTDRDGLPSDTVLDVLQDKTGYIWLASYEGLVRFDGDRFVVMGSETGFTGKSARTLALSPDGTLWIGTNTAGLYSFHDGVFTSWGLRENLPDLSVRSLAVSPDGAVWIGTANGVALLREGVITVPVPSGNSKFGIANFLVPLQDGSVLAGSNLPGLWRITENGIKPFLPDDEAASYSFSSAFLDAYSQLWAGTSSGLLFRISRNEIRERIDLDLLRGASINSFHTDRDGTLWIACDRGIVSKRDAAFDSFSELNGLPSNVVSALFRDTEGNLWVGTERGGLVKFSPGKFVNISRKDGLAGDAINSVTEDQYRSLWIATDQGVSYFPSAADPSRKDGPYAQQITALLSRLKGVRVRQIRSERDGTLWFSTYSSDGLLVFYPDGTIKTITTSSGLPINRVRFSFRTSAGDLWVGTTAGPVLFSGGIARTFSGEAGLSNLFILGATEDASGNIWLGTDGGGIAVYDGSGFTPWTTEDGLPGNVVFRVYEDHAKRLWISSSEGLGLYQDGQFYRLKGITSWGEHSVFEVLEDRSRNLWIITGNKVIVASANDLADAMISGYAFASFRIYDRLDGLAGQLSANAWAFMNEHGIVYLPTLKGLSTFNPQTVIHNSLPPPVLVEQIVADGNPVPMTDSIVIPSSVRRLTFEFTALSYVIPQRVRFHYMLEGYDRTWISAGTRREIGYTNLPPGEYRFRVKAGNNDGILNEEGSGLSFRKKPYFYQTVPFYLLCGMSLIMSGFFAAWMRVRQLNRRAGELSRLVRIRTAELEQEKEKSDSLLVNILPAKVADELKEKGYASPQVYSESAVLFADLVGFTPWSAGMDPSDIIDTLNEIFTAFDDIMSKHDCERIKTLGDGYLATSALHNQDSRSALRLTAAAVDMMRYIDDRTRVCQDKLELRIGISSGAIVGGVVGVNKYIFDVFGDAVNLAFRLQSSSVPMGITISEEVHDAISDHFVLVERPRLSVKGVGEVPAWFVQYRKPGNAPCHLTGSFSYGQELIRKVEEIAGRFCEDSSVTHELISLIEGIDRSILECDAGRLIYGMAADLAERCDDRDHACVWRYNSGHFTE